MPIAGFRQRVITAIIFAIFVIGLILGGRITSYLLIIIISLTSALEYEKTVHGRYLGIYGISVAIIFAIIYYLPASYYPILIALSCLLGGLLIAGVFKVEKFLDHYRYGSLINIFYIGIPMAILAKEILDMENVRYFLFGIITLVWLSDSGAYLVGSKFGKRKLLPRVSPKKTVEGLMGSIFLTIAGSAVLGFITDIRSLVWWLVIGALVSLVGSLGDLVQSSIKRKFRIKDSGSLLPGHGGFWDRFDSLILAIPFVLLFDYLWHK